MANTQQAVQTPSDAGQAAVELAASLVAAASGDNLFQNNGRVMFHVVATASAVTLTFVNQTQEDAQPQPNRVVNVAANQEMFIGPFQPGIFNDSDGLLHVQVNTPANLSKFRAIQMPSPS